MFAQQEAVKEVAKEEVKQVVKEAKVALETKAVNQEAQKVDLKAEKVTEIKKEEQKQAVAQTKATPITTTAAHAKTLKPPAVEKKSVNSAK